MGGSEAMNMNVPDQEEEEECTVEFEVPLGEAAKTFNLEKTVCSHGLFMMSPNHWDPFSRTFSRPLRLDDSLDSDSVLVSISHPSSHPSSLSVRVHGVGFLSPKHRESLQDQVVRMLRLSDVDEFNTREFRRIAAAAEIGDKECIFLRDFSGRVFRSPNLFEDMVKCILFCNCQWSRTLSMARALCELQLELQSGSPIVNGSSISQLTHSNDFVPKTPAGKERKRKKLRVSNASKNVAGKLLATKMELDSDSCLTVNDAQLKRKGTLSPNFHPNLLEDNCKSCDASSKLCETDSCATAELDIHQTTAELDIHQRTQSCASKRIGYFPSPMELAKLDERFLAKRCGLGYRAGRIIELSQGIVDGKIPLRELEEVRNGGNLSIYDELADQLREINGFGPFTRANVLMCMGFYHVIPSDSETVRHLKKVHARNSSIKTVQEDVEEIYGKYAPFQFLAYWAELWHFYEQRFGKFTEMPSSDYKLVTASNMRNKASSKTNRTNKRSW